HSGQLSASTETTSRGRRPSPTRPKPAWRARAPYWRQLIDRQIPSSFSRIATLSPRSRTTCRNSLGRVSCPSTVHAAPSPPAPTDDGATSCVATRMSPRPPRRGSLPTGALPTPSAPRLLALPPPRAPDARLLHPEVELLDVVLLEEA